MRAGASSVSVADGALAAEPAPGAERVLGVQLGLVVVADRRGDAALRVPAVRGERPAPSRAGARRASAAAHERRVQPGDPAADDDQIVLTACLRGFLLKVDNLWQSLHGFRPPSENTPSRPRRRSPSSSRCATGACRCCSGSARSTRSPARWSLPGGELAAGRDARGVDPPPPRGEGRRARALAPRAARDAAATRAATRSGGSSPPPTSASSRATSTRRCPPTRAGTRSTRCRPLAFDHDADRARRPRAAARRSSRTRTSASRSRRTTFTISELRDLYRAALGHEVSATNLQRVLLRRDVLVPTGEPARAGPDGRAARPPLFRFRARELEITISSRSCYRRLRLAARLDEPPRPGQREPRRGRA